MTGTCTDPICTARGGRVTLASPVVGISRRVPAENLRDPDSVDQRRAAVGLDPMAKYLALMREPPPEQP
ncbi:hypothetical protein [Pseudonocardia sp. T1-2H]|uniref:hypothetical protein n=1 Tax=Pseudonocardia sp. T1-2H TaxID=3128899 RepID=UPI0031015615